VPNNLLFQEILRVYREPEDAQRPVPAEESDPVDARLTAAMC
jgi:hypothetical protein